MTFTALPPYHFAATTTTEPAAVTPLTMLPGVRSSNLAPLTAAPLVSFQPAGKVLRDRLAPALQHNPDLRYIHMIATAAKRAV
ncbi:hypothetical protein GCM10009779_66070 [Polymorphospora rubra]|uniref:Uncharacterized protein n=1 Tax=Polymorphospora rubra TaxID=338584 RepID=A0A810MUD7_9ACTN|nr:hypothetical protein Prubr_18470 [Polymorphospora rubra]